MSPHAELLDTAATPKPGNSRQTSPVVPAGRITLPEGFAADPALELRLYHLAPEDYLAPGPGPGQGQKQAAMGAGAASRHPRDGRRAAHAARQNRGSVVGSRPPAGDGAHPAFEVVAGKTHALQLGPPAPVPI